MSVNFRGGNRKQLFLLPPSVADWLPDDHLARFVVEIVEQLDLSSISNEYGGRGSTAYSPGMMVALLFYSYATGSMDRMAEILDEKIQAIIRVSSENHLGMS